MKNFWLIKAAICALGVEVNHILVEPVQCKIKNETLVRMWATSKKFVEANPNQTPVE